MTTEPHYTASELLTVMSCRLLEDGQVREHGPRLALVADPTSRFARLLRLAVAEVSR